MTSSGPLVGPVPRSTCGEDGIVRLWDIDSGALVAAMPGHGGWVSGVAWDPSGERAVSGSEDGTLRLVNLRPVFEAIVGRHEGGISAVAWGPTASVAAAAAGAGGLRIWPIGTGSEPVTLPGEEIAEVAWSPDGSVLVTGSFTGAMAVWDTASWTLKAELPSHADRVTRIAWSPDGLEFLTGSYDRTVRLWNALTGQVVATLVHDQWISDLAWNPVRRQAVIAPWEERAYLWDIAVDQEDIPPIRPLTGHTAILHAAAWSPDGSLAMTTSGDGTARIWDAASGETTRILRTGEAFTAAWHPKGHQVLTGSRDGLVRIWDLASGADVVHLRHPGAVRSARWNPAATQILSGGDDGVVRIWSIHQADVVRDLGQRVGRLFSDEEIRREIPQWQRGILP